MDAEKVARAICETLFGPYDPASAGPNLMFTPEAQSLRAARAAIAAMGDQYRAGYEAAREQAAGVAERTRDEFLSPQYAANQPLGSFCERFACEEVAAAIRSMEPK